MVGIEDVIEEGKEPVLHEELAGFVSWKCRLTNEFMALFSNEEEGVEPFPRAGDAEVVQVKDDHSSNALQASFRTSL